MQSEERGRAPPQKAVHIGIRRIGGFEIHAQARRSFLKPILQRAFVLFN
jgi:hypothetical protein